MCSHINVGSKQEIAIKDLAELIKEVVGFQGQITFDPDKPDGMPRKLLNSEKIHHFGFKQNTSLKEGLIKTYEEFKKL
jgi:GDP-L-fucose synthase